LGIAKQMRRFDGNAYGVYINSVEIRSLHGDPKFTWIISNGFNMREPN
jgi:hypothetical protein